MKFYGCILVMRNEEHNVPIIDVTCLKFGTKVDCVAKFHEFMEKSKSKDLYIDGSKLFKYGSGFSAYDTDEDKVFDNAKYSAKDGDFSYEFYDLDTETKILCKVIELNDMEIPMESV